MPYPASKDTLEQARISIDRAAVLLRKDAQLVRDRSAAGTATREEIIDLKRKCKNAEDRWDAALAEVDNDALRDWVREQKSDPTLDLVAEYQAMRAACVALRNWIHDNLPVDVGTGAAIERISNSDGTYSAITVPAGVALSVSFRTQADALLATIG